MRTLPSPPSSFPPLPSHIAAILRSCPPVIQDLHSTGTFYNDTLNHSNDPTGEVRRAEIDRRIAIKEKAIFAIQDAHALALAEQNALMMERYEGFRNVCRAEIEVAKYWMRVEFRIGEEMAQEAMREFRERGRQLDEVQELYDWEEEWWREILVSGDEVGVEDEFDDGWDAEDESGSSDDSMEEEEDSSDDSDDTEDLLPEGWEMRLTESGQAYFVDQNTQTMTWDDPRYLSEAEDGSGDDDDMDVDLEKDDEESEGDLETEIAEEKLQRLSLR